MWSHLYMKKFINNMKNNMKKTIVGIFAFVTLFVGQTVFANVVWNGSQTDCPTINIANVNTGQGGPSGICWTGTNINASPGDIISVKIYFHNNGDETATNTVVRLTAPQGAGTTLPFSGAIYSTQRTGSTQVVKANIPSAQTATYISTKLYRNSNGNGNLQEVVLPNGQTGEEVIANGLSIGDVPANIASQGAVVVRFKISENTPISTCNIDSFSGNPSSISNGASSLLSWNTTGCITTKLGGTTVSVDGSSTVSPSTTTTYTLQGYDANGNLIDTNTTTVNVSGSTSGMTGNIDANDSTCDIQEGQSSCSVYINWSTQNPVGVSSVTNNYYTVANGNNGGQSMNIPYGTQRYYLYNNGIELDSTSVRARCESGTSWTGSYCKENNDNNNDDRCYIDEFTVNGSSSTTIEVGGYTTLNWETTACDSVSISNIGNVSDDGGRVIYPYRTTTYILSAYGSNSVSKSVTVYIKDVYVPPTPVYNNNVVTTIATNVSNTGAQINGLITNTNFGQGTTYFEYGTTVGLGSRTASRTTGGNSSFSEYLTGLRSNTIYYFRAVAENNNGVSRGAIEVFKTTGNTYVNTNNTNTNTTTTNTFVQGPTVYGSTSPIMLKIENRYQTIGVGDIVDYVVYYKNISGSTLTNPMVQVYIPQGITLTNYSRGTYSDDNRTLSAPIEVLYPGAEGFIYLQARVDSIEASLAQIVTTAVLIYTNPNGAQENAMVYVLNNPRLGNSLGAAALFGSGIHFTLIDWLLLVIFIMLIVLVARSFFTKRQTFITTPQTHN